MKDWNVSLTDIENAYGTLQKILEPTPLLKSYPLSAMYGCDVFLKLETFQPIGSFKIRGAAYKILNLTAEEKKKGVIAASAGNHAQGVAWGCKQSGVNACIVMPKTAPLTKVMNTIQLGAKVIQEGDNYDEAFAHALEIEKKENRVFIHPYEDQKIISGQGTIGLEILEQLPEVDAIFGSIGGGGMMAGIGIVMKAKAPHVKVIGCQAQGAQPMAQSFLHGKPMALENIKTFADGIAVKKATPKMFEILRPLLHKVETADDDAIFYALLKLIEKAKIISEGAGALPLAVLSQTHEHYRGKKVVLMVSGGNIDVNILGRIIDKGLIHSGRRLRVEVLIPDRPGSLSYLASVVGNEGANILESQHDRNQSTIKIDQTSVTLTLETRGQEHSDQIIQTLKKIFGFARLIQ